MLSKLKNAVNAHRPFLIIFGALMLYEVCAVGKCAPWRVGGIAHSLYALDYSFGFADKILPGAIYHLFFKDASPAHVALFSAVLLVLFFFTLAFFLEKLYLSAEKNDRLFYAVGIWFFLTGPATFSVFVAELGIIEVFWFYLAALFFLLMSRPRLAPLTVLICVAALLVNSAAILVVVPMFCILLLYRLSFETEKKGKRLFLFSFIGCVVVSLPFFAYLVICGKENMTYPYEEFRAMLLEKGIDHKYPGFFFYTNEMISELLPFYSEKDLSVFLDAYRTYIGSEGFPRLISFFVLQRQSVLSAGSAERLKDVAAELALLSPVLGAALLSFCRRFFDKTENRLRRFVFFCIPALFVLDLLCGVLFSLDGGKWISYSTIVLFTMFLYVLYTEGERAAPRLRSRLRRCPPAVTAVYALIYAFTFFSFY